MRQLILVLLVILSAWGACYAEDEPKRRAAPRFPSVEDVMPKVLRAVADADEASLARLANLGIPDVWLIADALSARGEYDAAAALARAAASYAVEPLSRYVAAQRETPESAQVRKLHAAVRTARRKRDAQAVLALCTDTPMPLASVPRLRIVTMHVSALRHLGRHEEAMKRLRAAGSGARRLGWLNCAAQMHRQAATAAARLARWDDAVALWTETVEIEELIGNKRRIAMALENLGSTLMSQGRDRAGLAPLLRAATLYAELGRVDDGAGALLQASHAQNRLGDLDAAFVTANRVLALLRGRDNVITYSSALSLRASLYWSRGDPGRSITDFESALALWRGRPPHLVHGHILDDMGKLYRMVGDPARALELHLTALGVFERVRHKRDMAIAHANVAKCHANLGDLDRSHEHFTRALALYTERADTRGIALTHGQLGYVQEMRGELDAAHRNLRRSLDLMQQLGHRPDVAGRLVGLGLVELRQGKFEAAVASLERARTMAQDEGYSECNIQSLWGLARVAAVQQRWAEAIELAQAAAGAASVLAHGLTESAGAGLRDLWSGIFDIGLLAAVEAGDQAAALAFIEQGRASFLREALGAREALRAAVMPEALRVRYDAARAAAREARETFSKQRAAGGLKGVRQAKKALRQAELAVEESVAAIRRDARAAAGLVFPQPTTLAEVKALVGAGEALVLYGAAHGTNYAFVIDADSTRLVDLGPAQAIKVAVDRLLVEGAPHVDPAGAPLLRARIVEPLGLTKEIRRVLISPIGRLGYVPLALLWPEREATYVPSATTYGLLRAEHALRGTRVLGLGDPDYAARPDASRSASGRGVTGRQLARLPATRTEIAAVADEQLLGAAASEAGLRGALGAVERWRAVHFACHGLVDPDRPLLSCLALTPSGEDDGFLTCLEVLSMRLPADMAVLSACDTGKGRAYRVEGIVGLTRAFMFAGAPRVLCSLWRVDDEATQALMVKFYELWNPRTGGPEPKPLGAAAALRQAQSFVRSHEKWKHPRYWAAWVLWGLPD